MTIIKAIELPDKHRRRRTNTASGTPESYTLKAVKDWADAHSPHVYLVRIVDAGSNGTPDFIMNMRGVFVGIECKSSTGRLSKLQEYHGELITKADGIFIYGDADTIIPALDQLWEYMNE